MNEIKLFYYYAKENFGDALNLSIAENLFGVKPLLAHPYHSDYTMIGSILESFILKNKTHRNRLKKILLPPINVFGSGFITEQRSPTESYIRKVNLHAVRGSLTKDRFSRNLKKDFTKITMGDPGLLASRIDSNNASVQYDIGIIPHMINAEDPQIEFIKTMIPNSIIINILDPVQKVLAEIKQCDMILSNAMHGLIAADSFGIPNKRLILQKELIGGDYKFKDYYSAFNLPLQESINFNIASKSHLLESINSIKKNYSISPDQIKEIQGKLISAAPFKK